MNTAQIHANISPEIRDRLDRFARARGLRKGFVVEQALLHHLSALDNLPQELILPPRIVIGSDAGERVLNRIEGGESPNATMRELFDEAKDGPGT